MDFNNSWTFVTYVAYFQAENENLYTKVAVVCSVGVQLVINSFAIICNISFYIFLNCSNKPHMCNVDIPLKAHTYMLDYTCSLPTRDFELHNTNNIKGRYYEINQYRITMIVDDTLPKTYLHFFISTLF